MALSSCGSLSLPELFCVSLSVKATWPLHIKHFCVKLAVMTRLCFLKGVIKRFSGDRKSWHFSI